MQRVLGKGDGHIISPHRRWLQSGRLWGHMVFLWTKLVCLVFFSLFSLSHFLSLFIDLHQNLWDIHQLFVIFLFFYVQVSRPYYCQMKLCSPPQIRKLWKRVNSVLMKRPAWPFHWHTKVVGWTGRWPSSQLKWLCSWHWDMLLGPHQGNVSSKGSHYWIIYLQF